MQKPVPTLLNGTIHTYAHNTSVAFCATRQSSKCYCATGDAIVQQDAVSNSESGRRPCANTAKETHTCTHARKPDLEVPVVELLGACLAAEVPGHPAQLPRQASLTQLVAVVTRDALQAQTLDEVLLE